MNWAKYEAQPTEEQVKAYRSEGYPRHNGLAACTVIVRRTAAAVATFGDAWWREDLRWTSQDQLSLSVVRWRLGLTNHWIDGHLWFNPWYDHDPHRLEEGYKIASGQLGRKADTRP